MKDIKHLDLGYGLVIENNELKDLLTESDNSLNEMLTWEEGWEYVIQTIKKLKPYEDDNSK